MNRVCLLCLVRMATLALFALILVLPATASAHPVGLSSGEYVAHARDEGSVVRVKLTFARAELLTLSPDLGPTSLEETLLRRISVVGDDQPCLPEPPTVRATEQDGIAVASTFTCSATAEQITVSLGIFGDLSHGHRHLVHAVGIDVVDDVCHAGHSTFGFSVASAAPNGEERGERRGEEPGRDAARFVRMGVEHILTGWDHLLFLFGLVIVGGRVRSLVGVVTAFTIAHSITLACGAMGIWAPSPRFVEPLIALSIAYVGVENFFVKSAERRWRLTLVFGLVHGFGFAGALREIDLPSAKIPLALVTFNTGVELGQLAVIALVSPLVWLVQRPALRAPVVRVMSAAVIALGLFWFVERVLAT